MVFKSKILIITLIINILFISGKLFSENDTLKYNNLLHKAFNQHYNFFNSYISGEKHTRIYDIQTWTNQILESSFALKEYSLLDSLAALYLKAYSSLKEMDRYYFLYDEQIDTIIFDRPMKLWTNSIKRMIDSNEVTLDEELPLNSSQFAFLLSRFIHLSCKNSESLNYPNIDSLIKVYFPILLDDHYKRWILDDYDFFQLKGWGCIKGRYNHKEFTELRMKEKFRKKPSYCSSVTDIDLWIPAGLSELLMANKINPELIPIDPTDIKNYKDYINLMMDFVKSKLQISNLINFQGEKVQGYNFDIKAWTDYYENFYARNENDSFPSKKDKGKLKQIGWDLSHARRFVTFFETMFEYKQQFNTSFPDTSTMKLLANQFIYKAFNGNFDYPLFTNYIDGTNGWYRVNYHGEGFGYAPHDMSISAVTGGFLFWSKYNSDIEGLKQSLWNHISKNTDHWKKYYGRFYYEFKRTKTMEPMNIKSYDSIILLQFLPILIY